jgi:SAM-dependent methyltransferase
MSRAASLSAAASADAPATVAIYPMGHSEAVLSSHKSRTAQNSASYALQALKDVFTEARLKLQQGGSGQLDVLTLLDVGCGPGTITVGFAEILTPLGGRVIGVDFAAGVLEGARALAAEKGVSGNCIFEQGDVFALRFADASLTAAHLHQVLMHLRDPVAALKEIRRVLNPACSILALREADFGATSIFPSSPGLVAWASLWKRVADGVGGQPDAGRRVKHWALEAGFREEKMTMTAGTFCYSTAQERAWWGGLWAERTAGKDSSWAQSSLRGGYATQQQLDEIATAWREWSQQKDGTFIMPHGELVIKMGN